MEIGISTASFFLRQECEDAIATIENLGVKYAEVFLGTYYEYRPEFAKKFAPKDGIKIPSVHALSTNFEPQLFSDSRRVRGDAFYWLDQFLRSAQLFGADRYSFHGCVSHGRGGEDVEKTGAFFREICDFAARYQVSVCLENVAWCTYNRPGVFREIKSRCPQISGVFDIKQARRSGYPYQMYIEDMSGAISHVHLSDMDENGRMCLPGRGVYDFEEIFKRLKGAGFDGTAFIEVYGRDYGEYAELKKSAEYLEEILYKLK